MGSTPAYSYLKLINTMSYQEKRLIPRIQLGSVPPGAVTLLMQGKRITVERLRDISHSGISFFIDQALTASDGVTLEYQDTHVKLEVFGRIAWCSQARAEAAHGPQGTYLVGLELLSPMMLYAVLPKA